MRLVWSLLNRLVTKLGKEVGTMKIATAFVAALLFTGVLGTLNSAVADDDVILQQKLTPASYCHLKFTALKSETVPGEQPQVIDFYGPCNETRESQDQIQDQRNQYGNDWANNFASE